MWMNQEWWNLLEGYSVVRYYPAGTHLFSRPGTEDNRDKPGSTVWPVVVVHRGHKLVENATVLTGNSFWDRNRVEPRRAIPVSPLLRVNREPHADPMMREMEKQMAERPENELLNYPSVSVFEAHDTEFVLAPWSEIIAYLELHPEEGSVAFVKFGRATGEIEIDATINELRNLSAEELEQLTRANLDQSEGLEDDSISQTESRKATLSVQQQAELDGIIASNTAVESSLT